MRRITTVLKSSEAVAVRKAVTAAGASLVIVTPSSSHNGVVNFGEWCGNGAGARADGTVRLEVIVEDATAHNIASAILANAHTCGIENIIPYPAGRRTHLALPEISREAINA